MERKGGLTDIRGAWDAAPREVDWFGEYHGTLEGYEGDEGRKCVHSGTEIA
jgi:hypothetical protein